MSIASRKMLGNPAELQQHREMLLGARGNSEKRVCVCIGTGCAAKGARKVYELFRTAVHTSGADVAAESVKCVGCHGFCEHGPIVIVHPGDIFYQRVEEPDVAEIFRETVLGGRVVERLLYKDPITGTPARIAGEIPFYSAQHRIVLAGNGIIDPTSIDDYIAAGGYAALARVLTSMSPMDVIAEVELSQLRGRGGGGFSTARKWRLCHETDSLARYVICNGDEGDPGAFMDRSIMEGNPHSIIEGMIIGAYAVGADQGYVYVRNEYPLAVEHLRNAVSQGRAMGLIGRKIFGSSFSFDIKVNRGGGAFVCGESTALMASLEGRPGEPRAKYVHTVESGLWGKPTCLNNVETWANIPAIINEGGRSFALLGTEGSKGTKVFSLVGKVVNSGLVEVPMGMTLRQIVYDLGGGIKDDKAFKAVQTGGPSGGCIPDSLLDTPVDFDELKKLGSMMGSGGMIVMDEDDCMVHIARYFLNFLKDESCGKCTPCREGLAQMLYILDRITHGDGTQEDLVNLDNLAELLAATALCALGKTAANPVLSTIRYFKDEYESHILHRRCPAKVCRGLFFYAIDPEICKGCGICRKHCLAEAVCGDRRKPHRIIREKCTLCGACLDKCPFGAVTKI